MILLVQLLLFAAFIYVCLQVFKTISGDNPRIERRERRPDGDIIEGTARDVSTPAKAAAETLREFENLRSDLRARYPSLFAMLGGYLNESSIHEAGGIEAAVRRMLDDWAGRSDEVSRELTSLLADTETEEETRAVILAACDAELDQEGYRKWATWLLGRFNAL